MVRRQHYGHRSGLSDAGGRPRPAGSVPLVDEASLIVTGAARAAAERIAREVWQHNELSLQEVRSAEVHRRELTDAGFTITAVHLDVRAKIPGADKAAFDSAANNAKAGCPVSRVLNATITMNAALEA